MMGITQKEAGYPKDTQPLSWPINYIMVTRTV
ncbi:hypothetical protein SAMN06296056_1172 [Priestia filamentosa]|nr:hypothetical protein SAMN06296056_1172 [Priestia filamentosa]